MNTPNNAKSAASIAAIKRAFMELAAEKPYQQISVMELCKKASVNRTTFYSHFSGVQDVIAALDDDLYQKIVKNILPAEREAEKLAGRDTMRRVLTAIKQHELLYRSYLPELRNSKIVRELTEYAKRQYVLCDDSAGTVQPWGAEYHFEFCAQGTIGILEKWISEGCGEDVEKMAALIEATLNRCIPYQPFQEE